MTESDSGLLSVGSITAQYPNPVNFGEVESPDNLITPRLDLHAYDSEGRHVGLNYTTGEFETEIPGVSEEDVSGTQSIFQWIGAPRSEGIRFEVDSRRVGEYIRYIEERLNTTIENDTTDFTLRIDEYGQNPKVNETTGEVTNVSTIESELSIEPNETTTVSVPAEVDFDPDTLNKRGSGRWVKVELRIPNRNVSVENIDLSTVRLNGEVGAVTDDRYGFVRNPVKDGVLTVKFNRSEVSEVLDTGENVSVFVLGKTQEGVVASGTDEVRVIDRGRGGNKRRGSGPPGGDSGRGKKGN